MNKKCEKCKTDSSVYTLQKCRHNYCEKCLYEHVNKMDDCKIKCPFINCNKIISDQDIRKFLSTYRIKKYENLQFSNTAIRRCLTKNCPFIYIPEDDFIFQCEYCKQPNCTKCQKRHYHKECLNNEDHEENREKSAQEAISKRKREEIEAYDTKSDLVPNIDGFVCPICSDFFLPNTQKMLRTCQHNFCFECLQEELKSQKSFKRLSCPICDKPLTSVEMIKVVGMEFVDSLNKSVIQTKLYLCKYPECKGCWDFDSQKKEGGFECPECRNMNCISCGTVHKIGETCSEYQKCDEYKDYELALQDLKSKKSVTCQCGKLLIHGCGCGAMYCDNCREQICLFTGLFVGKNPPEGCGCTAKKPCDTNCKYGCFIETPD